MVGQSDGHSAKDFRVQSVVFDVSMHNEVKAAAKGTKKRPVQTLLHRPFKYFIVRLAHT